MNTVLKKPERSARKAKGDGHLRRAEILRAAERIFVADGYEGATIRKIADEVGVSSTALYMHFADKDRILLEICDQAMSALMEINREIAQRPVDAVSRVRAMLEAYVAFARANPNAYSLVFCASSLADSTHRQQATMELGRQCFERFSGVVREIAADGRLRAGDARSAAQTLWAACHGLIALRMAKPDFDWAPPNELTAVMIEGLLFGLIAD
ncbi:MAG: TetR/AcrR family transcriptional regulator [Pseudomonadota bacterium]|nr:TetR/AcrR family transcriptional regulator [Pseudomonadota bacterium]